FASCSTTELLWNIGYNDALVFLLLVVCGLVVSERLLQRLAFSFASCSTTELIQLCYIITLIYVLCIPYENNGLCTTFIWIAYFQNISSSCLIGHVIASCNIYVLTRLPSTCR